jgi:hypothetical protein
MNSYDEEKWTRNQSNSFGEIYLNLIASKLKMLRDLFLCHWTLMQLITQ